MTTKSKQDKHKMSEIDENISRMFDIKKRLGKGAYGIVWKALDKRNNDTIAVKKIFDAFRDETDAQRTFREIIFLKAFRSHPNVVKLHNVYRASNNLDIYLIFEFMESDLHNIIKKGSILKDIHKRYVMYQLINAVKYIHSGNVIHRDLKPSNVLIDSKCRCKLADFGLARSVANQSVRNDSNDSVSGDKPVEPLLTDYVATRWYRAPEILVASKRYTKGIDMWSLGCILGEMIRGKPLFQGSSTVNQIEKIVSTLPDVTEHDIRSVGAGFGSVLLNKTISRENKITLNELLIDASKDAMDLVKSLLVLDPMGRLTAKQALSHPYLEKFRNSIPEKELSFDVLPPFRDDVRLTVPEYRSKLYEILNVADGEKRHGDGPLKPLLSSSSKQRIHEKSELKKPVKNKPILNGMTLNKEWNTQIACISTTVINRSQAKISPLSKRKLPKTSNEIRGVVSEGENLKADQIIPLEEKHTQSSKSSGHIHQNFREDPDKRSLPQVKRNSISHTESVSQTNKRLTSSHRLCRSSTTLNKVETDALNNSLLPNKSVVDCAAPTAAILKATLRPTKSEMHYPPKQLSSNEKSQTGDRVCYERRLKILEEEIERYKNEVKTFCRETFIYSRQKSLETHKSDEHSDKLSNGGTSTPPKNLSMSTPTTQSYLQLVTKGNQHDAKNSNYDLSSGNSGGSDRYIHTDNNKSYSSSRRKDVNKPMHNHKHRQRLSHQQHHCPDDLGRNQHLPRNLSKFK